MSEESISTARGKAADFTNDPVHNFIAEMRKMDAVRIIAGDGTLFTIGWYYDRVIKKDGKGLSEGAYANMHNLLVRLGQGEKVHAEVSINGSAHTVQVGRHHAILGGELMPIPAPAEVETAPAIKEKPESPPKPVKQPVGNGKPGPAPENGRPEGMQGAPLPQMIEFSLPSGAEADEKGAAPEAPAAPKKVGKAPTVRPTVKEIELRDRRERERAAKAEMARVEFAEKARWLDFGWKEQKLRDEMERAYVEFRCSGKRERLAACLKEYAEGEGVAAALERARQYGLARNASAGGLGKISIMAMRAQKELLKVLKEKLAMMPSLAPDFGHLAAGEGAGFRILHGTITRADKAINRAWVANANKR